MQFQLKAIACAPVHESQQLLSTAVSIGSPFPVHLSMCLTLCLGFGSEKGSVYLVGMLRETRGVVVYGGVVLVGRVVLNGEGV